MIKNIYLFSIYLIFIILCQHSKQVKGFSNIFSSIFDDLKFVMYKSNMKIKANCLNDLTQQIIYDKTSEDNKLNNSNNSKKLRIIHFNDVYNIEPDIREPVGGAARFVTAINMVLKEEPSLVFFSGDVFSPSTLSMISKGEQMVPILNKLNIEATCFGNHDFDFGIDKLIELSSATNFPWLMSNVIDIITNKPLANGKTKHIVHFNDIKIGLIGLVEEEWIETLSIIDFDDIIYEPFVDAGRKFAKELKNIDKVDIVIALTHMRSPNDILLADEVPEIDIVLGGHDHNYWCESVNDTFILKSGTDFKDFSLLQIDIEPKSDDSKQRRAFMKKIQRFTIDSKIEEDKETKLIVKKYIKSVEEKFKTVLGVVHSDLDGRFTSIRSHETNLGNFICDIVLENVAADCALLNSGTFRYDSIIPAGNFTLGDLKKILPFPDSIVVIQCDGKTLYEVLENSVSQYPKLEGRFLQVSGVEFAFDPKKPSGSRIDPKLVKVQDEYLDFTQDYKIATIVYLKKGNDGYQMLSDCNILIDDEDGPLLFTLVENHFHKISKLLKLNNENQFNLIEPSVKKLSQTHNNTLHHDLIMPIVRRNTIIKRLINSNKINSKRSSFSNSDNGNDNINNNLSKLFERFNSSLSPKILNRSASNNDDEVNHHNDHLDYYKNELNHKHSASVNLRRMSLKYSTNLTHTQIDEVKKSKEFINKIREYEEISLKMKPEIEGRIIMIDNDEIYQKLLKKREDFFKNKELKELENKNQNIINESDEN